MCAIESFTVPKNNREQEMKKIKKIKETANINDDDDDADDDDIVTREVLSCYIS